MRIVESGYKILTPIDGDKMLRNIERIARTCYKSEDNITPDSAKQLVRSLLTRGHEAMLEHESITVRVICDRGVSHEWVRHRVASYAQESTRYCNYHKNKHGGELTFIKPTFFREGTGEYNVWYHTMVACEIAYMSLIREGVKPEQARSVLPNSLKTELVCTMNLREWRHFFYLRTANTAHPQIREIAIPLLADFKSQIPVVFDDIEVRV